MPPRFLCQERKGGWGQQENSAEHEQGESSAQRGERLFPVIAPSWVQSPE